MASRSLGGVSMTDMSRMPGEAHLQGARDGRGGEGQAVHGRAQLLEPLLGRHAEALLLVDHEEAEVAEDHVLARGGGGCR